MERGILINYENKFEVTYPPGWSRKSSLDNHLVLHKGPKELIVIRRDDIRLFSRVSLDEYMHIIRDNVTVIKQFDNVETSTLESFSTPFYHGKIMTYAFSFDDTLTEITIFAFNTQSFFYLIMLQAPTDCPKEVLAEYFEIVNSFRLITESIDAPKFKLENVRFKPVYDWFREVSIMIPDDWLSIIDFYRTETDYSIFVSSEDSNQVAGVTELLNFSKSHGHRLAQVASAVRGAYPEPIVGTDYKILDIGGHKALQYEEENVPHVVHLKFLNTIVESEDAFFFISCWTPPAFYDEYAKLFEHVTNSFTLYRAHNSSEP